MVLVRGDVEHTHANHWTGFSSLGLQQMSSPDFHCLKGAPPSCGSRSDVGKVVVWTQGAVHIRQSSPGDPAHSPVRS